MTKERGRPLIGYRSPIEKQLSLCIYYKLKYQKKIKNVCIYNTDRPDIYLSKNGLYEFHFVRIQESCVDFISPARVHVFAENDNNKSTKPWPTQIRIPPWNQSNS